MNSPSVQAIADLHGFLPHTSEIPESDILLIAGDIAPDFHRMSRARYGANRSKPVEHKGEHQQADWLNTVFREWLDVIRARGTEVVATWGNHDFVGEKPYLVPDLDWHLLVDDEVTVHGLRIWSTPWCPNLRRWAFQIDDHANDIRVSQIPDGLDILMTHSPPYGVLDFVAPQFGSVHVGDEWLRHEMDRLNVPTMVCGHIHEQRGVEKVELKNGNFTVVINVAHIDEKYDKVRGPVDISNYVVK